MPAMVLIYHPDEHAFDAIEMPDGNCHVYAELRPGQIADAVSELLAQKVTPMLHAIRHMAAPETSGH